MFNNGPMPPGFEDDVEDFSDGEEGEISLDDNGEAKNKKKGSLKEKES